MASEECTKNKVVLVGDFGVGKTTIFTRFKTGRAEGGDLNTRKECECSKQITVDGRSTCVRSHYCIQSSMIQCMKKLHLSKMCVGGTSDDGWVMTKSF